MKNWIYGIFVFATPYSNTLVQGNGLWALDACEDARRAIPSGAWVQVGGEHLRCAYGPRQNGECPGDYWICTFPIALRAR